MDPRVFLELAEELSERTDSEAAQRTSVSRSYYALYLLLHKFLKSKGISLPDTAVAHERVYRYLHNCGLQEVRSVASHLNDLRDERNIADYQLEETEFRDARVASLLFNKAQKAYDSFQECISDEENAGHVVRGINAYRKKTNT